MQCEDCQLLKNFNITDKGADITCSVNGKFQIAREYFKTYNCPEYLVEPDKKPEQFIYFVLKNGSTLKMKSNMKMDEIMEEISTADFFMSGDTMVRISEVAALRVVEE